MVQKQRHYSGLGLAILLLHEEMQVKELSRLAGVHESAISEYTRGSRALTENAARRLLAPFQYDPQVLDDLEQAVTSVMDVYNDEVSALRQ